MRVSGVLSSEIEIRTSAAAPRVAARPISRIIWQPVVIKWRNPIRDNQPKSSSPLPSDTHATMKSLRPRHPPRENYPLRNFRTLVRRGDVFHACWERGRVEGGSRRREGGSAEERVRSRDKVHIGIVRGTRSHDYRCLGTKLTNRIVNFSAAIDRYCDVERGR